MDLKEEIIQLIATSFKEDVNTIKSAKNWTDLGLDSLDTVELIMKIEEKYSILIEEDEASTLVDVDSILDLVTMKLQGK